MRRQEEIQRLIAQGVVSYLVWYIGKPCYALCLLQLCVSLFLYTFASLCCYRLTVAREVVLVASCMLLLRFSLLSLYPKSLEAIFPQIRLDFIASFLFTEYGCHILPLVFREPPAE
jgi:hypothetical protein